ncbi:MAG: diguanylate cyclase [Oscillospiraceae bacterium]|nr:diguanylate cyclase [Oscillospiraceae bacterium]
MTPLLNTEAFEKAKAFLNSFPAGIYRLRLTEPRCVDFVSEGLCAITGYTREELLRLTPEGVPAFVCPSDRERISVEFAVLERMAESAELEYGYIHKKKGPRLALDRVLTVKEEGGTVWGYCHFMEQRDGSRNERRLLSENEALRDSERLMRLVAEHSNRAVYSLDLASGALRSIDLTKSDLNLLPSFCRGLDRPDFQGCVLEESRAQLKAVLADIYSGKPEGETRLRITASNGEPRWFEVRYSLIPRDGEAPASALISFLDISDTHERELAYARYKQSVDSNSKENVLYYEADLDNDRIEKTGGSHLDLIPLKEGQPYSEAVERLRELYFSEADAQRAAKLFSRERLIEQFAAGVSKCKAEFPAVFKDGATHWIHCGKQMVADPYSKHIKVFTSVIDISEEKERESESRRLAEHDGMTGLYNRATGERLINETLAGGRRCALLMIDLDDLKNINDSLGHMEGDRALEGIAEAMRAHFRPGDILCRSGGDEFIALLADIQSKAGLRGAINAFLKKVSELRVGSKNEARVRCSIGVSFSFSDGSDFDTLYRQADLALYHVKRGGKNSFAFYTPEMERKDFKYQPPTRTTLADVHWQENSDYGKLLMALSALYPLIISANLTKNSYYMLEYDSFASHAAADYGNFDELIDTGASTFHPEDRASFLNAFSRQCLFEAHARGERSVTHEGRQMGDDGVYRWTRTHVVFASENEDVCQITFANNIEDEKNTQREALRMARLLEQITSRSFEYVCVLYTDTGEYELFTNVGSNSHSVPSRADFNEVTAEIRDIFVVEEEREEYYNKAALETVVRRMEETGGSYSYRYRLSDGEREAAFYYCEPTHSKLIMTVKKL